jgi:putative transposase
MRKQYSASFKTNMVVASLQGVKTLTQLAAENDVHPALISKWRDAALIDMARSFERRSSQEEEAEARERKVAELYEQIGRLTLQVSWLKKKSGLDPDTI